MLTPLERDPYDIPSPVSGSSLFTTDSPASMEDRESNKWALRDPCTAIVLKISQELAVCDPISDVHTPATQAWRPYDLKVEKFACLKDNWRPLLPSLDHGSSLSKDLPDAHVRNILTYESSDEPRDQTTQEFLGRLWRTGPPYGSITAKRAHHRVSADLIGHSLSKFQSSRQIMQVIYDAYLAHKDAFRICGILHRDISVVNILISLNGTGILSDWDMAHQVSGPSPRHLGRTGTWFFMSIKLLKDPTSIYILQDDLESFCYVVIYLALRYLPHNRVSVLPAIMANVFEHQYIVPTGVLGGGGKASMVHARGYIGEDLEFTDHKPLTAWIDTALTIIEDWSTSTRKWRRSKLMGLGNADGLELKLKDQAMYDHQGLDENFQTALAKKWPENDKGMDQLPPKGKNSYNGQTKTWFKL
ncbi:hypothetical protein M413DRAFT_32165 [Hebeloma cylindrosporum]|uniref:Fungal-type protein kinase domain-containing protein n=1 Tax=Hebeloma cylindrosporum TaxID=76867 RepID=A0A0C2XDF1_HEBCY|nr:hypothetical protein M413DRAFT_32165 [Hebeloma cylindrosporum h7]